MRPATVTTRSRSGRYVRRERPAERRALASTGRPHARDATEVASPSAATSRWQPGSMSPRATRAARDRRLRDLQSGTPAGGRPTCGWTTQGTSRRRVHSGTTQVATTSATYNTGSWYYVVASFSSTAGLKIYVNGTSVATNASATSAQAYDGYWTVGWAYGGLRPDALELLPRRLTRRGRRVPVGAVGSAGDDALQQRIGHRVELRNPCPRRLAERVLPLQSASTTATGLPVVASLPDLTGNNNLGRRWAA